MRDGIIILYLEKENIFSDFNNRSDTSTTVLKTTNSVSQLRSKNIYNEMEF